jgi:hypothetical protein
MHHRGHHLGKLPRNQTLDENKTYKKLNLGKRWVHAPLAVGDVVMIGREGGLSSGGREKALGGGSFCVLICKLIDVKLS